MNNYFESPDGLVGVTHADAIPRVRTPMTTCTHVGQLGAQPSDFGLSWLPIRPEQLARKRPVHPNWIGTFTAAEMFMAVRPLAWEPHVPTYRAAPRLHRIFPRAIFDPASGQAMVVAQQMAWDPKRKAPLIVRSRLRETLAFFYVPTLNVSVGTLTCTAMDDGPLTSPALLSETASTPTLLTENLAMPVLLNEGIC